MSVSVLAARNLCKSFGGVVAVDDVSFDLKAGTITGLIGPNGAGKTTLFNLMSGVERPDDGSTSLFGHRIDTSAPHRIARDGLVRTFQAARVFPTLSVRANVMAGGHMTAGRSPLAQAFWSPGARRSEAALRRRADAFLDIIGLTAEAERPAADLPMGAQKMLELARALMARPRVLLLDEPAAGLNDAETRDLAGLLKAVRDAGVTMLVVEHNLPLVMSVSDELLALDAGSLIAQGRPDEVRDDPRVREAYLGMSAEMDAPC
jgi:branched-chain amino acid transport system ATP-binding protein